MRRPSHENVQLKIDRNGAQARNPGQVSQRRDLREWQIAKAQKGVRNPVKRQGGAKSKSEDRMWEMEKASQL